jgi:hypothetical protein
MTLDMPERSCIVKDGLRAPALSPIVRLPTQARQMSVLGAMFRRVSEAHLSIAYEGPSVDAGTMDVRDLAPALLALGEVCQEANRILNGDRATLSVRVHADFPRGSFVIRLELVQTLIEQARTALFIGTAAISAQDILKFLGLKDMTLPGVIQFLKRLRGEKPHHAEPAGDGRVQVSVTGDNNVVLIDNEVAKLADSPRVRDGIRRMLEPLERDGIDKFEVRDDQRVVERIERQEVPYFTAAAADEPPMEQALLDSTSEAILLVIRPSFEKQYAWTVSAGDAPFAAWMLDDEFHAKVQADEFAFAAGDALRVRMRVVQRRGPSGRLIIERSIVEVVDVIPAPRPRQLNLLPPDDEGEG